MWLVYLAGDTPLPEFHCVNSSELQEWLIRHPNVYHKRLRSCETREEAVRYCKYLGLSYFPPPPIALPAAGPWPRKAPDWVPKGYKTDWLMQKRAKWRDDVRAHRPFMGSRGVPHARVNWLTGEITEYNPWNAFKH